jgi:hypothetical protein
VTESVVFAGWRGAAGFFFDFFIDRILERNVDEIRCLDRDRRVLVGLSTWKHWVVSPCSLEVQSGPRVSAARISLLALVLAGCGAHADAAPPSARPAADVTRELFRFQIDFWPNLNEALLHESLLPKQGFEGPKSLAHQSVAPAAALDGDEKTQWQSAIAYYDAHFSTHDTFEPAFDGGCRFLAASRSEPILPEAGLPNEWRVALSQAAPVYRARFWAEHERSDRAYVEALRPRLAEHGEWMARRLETLYRTVWPTDPIQVEVTAAVPPFGASTSGEPPFTGSHTPLVIVSSMDPGYTGDTGLEMLFHEASHLLVDKVQTALDASAKRQGRKLDERFWHFLLFYTAGHVARERLGPSYVPYAERPSNTIFTGRFAAFLPILERAWQPYLDGRVELEPAIDAVVASF